MNWLHDISYLFGGAFLAKSVPHFVSGMTGRPFQSPFARPPGRGLSSSTVNVLWGFANFVIAHLLISRVGDFDLHVADEAIAVGAGILLIAVSPRACSAGSTAATRPPAPDDGIRGMSKGSRQPRHSAAPRAAQSRCAS